VGQEVLGCMGQAALTRRDVGLLPRWWFGTHVP